MIANKRQPLVVEADDHLPSAQPVQPVQESANNKDTVKEIEFFSSSSSVSTIKKDLLLNQKIEKFKTKVSGILQQIHVVLDEDDEELLKKLFVFVCQSAEDYIIMPKKDNDKCNRIKKRIVTDMMKVYVIDEKLIGSIINMVMPSIKKATMYRRNKRFIDKVFFFVLSMGQNPQ